MQFSIANLESNVSDGGVVVAHYRINLVDGEYSSGAYGTINFTPDSTADGFTPYADLTEAQVIEWVKEALGGDEKLAEIEAALQAKIDEQKTPATTSGMPWVTE